MSAERFSLFDREDDLAFADCQLSQDDDISIHSGCGVAYDDPCGVKLDGTAWVYDAARDAWLVELRTCTGTRTDYLPAGRLVLTVTAEVAAMCGREAG